MGDATWHHITDTSGETLEDEVQDDDRKADDLFVLQKELSSSRPEISVA